MTRLASLKLKGTDRGSAVACTILVSPPQGSGWLIGTSVRVEDEIL
jgi:hypothetical protein